MINKLEKYRPTVFLYILILFFISLILAPNDINSKVLIGLVIVSLFYFSLESLKESLKHHFPLLLLFLLITISLVYTGDLPTGVQKIQRVLVIPLFFMVFPFANLSKRVSQQILTVFVFVVLIATVYSHVLVINSFFENGESSIQHLFNLNYSYLNLGNTLNLHPTYYTYFILVAISVVIDMLQKSNSLWIKSLYVLLIMYFSFFIVHLSSRIGILALYFLLLFNVVLYIRASKSWKKGALILVAVHLALFAIVWNIGVAKYRIQHIFGFEYYTGYKVNDGQHKLRLWGAAINANHNFLFGNGMGDINSSLNQAYTNLNNAKAVNENYNAHNQFIEYYVGLGIVGVLAFTYLLFHYGYTFLMAKNFLGLQFILITTILCLTESLWSRHHGVVFFVMTIGVLWSLNTADKSITPS